MARTTATANAGYRLNFDVVPENGDTWRLDIGQTLRNLTHERSLSVITIAAATEHCPDPPRVMFTNRRQSIFQCIRGVCVINNDIDVLLGLLERYRTQVVQALMADGGYSNPMAVPRLEKIVINMGVGEATADSKKPTVAGLSNNGGRKAVSVRSPTGSTPRE